MPSSEGYVTMDDGVRLFFETRGEGGPVVVVPNGMHLLDDFDPLARGRTLFFYDLRNRGRSDRVSDEAKLGRGIQQDVDDLDTVREHLGLSAVAVIGHSYLGLMAILYAMKHPSRVSRVVQIGPMEPRPGKRYPLHLTGADATLREVLATIAEMQKERGSEDPEAFCRRVWSVLRRLYVTDPADAPRIRWARCHLPNEVGFLKYWNTYVLPSIQALDLAPDALAKVSAPVLTIHGTRDRSAPYGGGREWALRLPNARLVTVEKAGHAPWIEAPETVFGSIEAFLGGVWPEAASPVESLDPGGEGTVGER